MKKFLSILFVLATVGLPACSSVTNEEIMSDTFIRQHGHSEEMVRLIDLQSSQINGTPTKFVSKEPAYYSQQPYKFIRSLFMYADKGLDDGKFMQNNIDYTNRYDDL